MFLFLLSMFSYKNSYKTFSSDRMKCEVWNTLKSERSFLGCQCRFVSTFWSKSKWKTAVKRTLIFLRPSFDIGIRYVPIRPYLGSCCKVILPQNLAKMDGRIIFSTGFYKTWLQLIFKQYLLVTFFWVLNENHSPNSILKSYVPEKLWDRFGFKKFSFRSIGKYHK